MGPQEVEVRVCRVQVAAKHQTSRAAATKGCMGEHPVLELQGDGLSPEEQQRLTAFLHKWQHVFAAHNEDFGCTNAVQHEIPTGVAHPPPEKGTDQCHQNCMPNFGYCCKEYFIAESS